MKDKRIHNPRRTLRLRRDESIDGEKIHSNVAYLLKFSIDLIFSITDLLPLRFRKAGKIFRGGAREARRTCHTKRLIAKQWSFSDLLAFLVPHGNQDSYYLFVFPACNQIQLPLKTVSDLFLLKFR